jgi:hypothetical protein
MPVMSATVFRKSSATGRVKRGEVAAREAIVLGHLSDRERRRRRTGVIHWQLNLRHNEAPKRLTELVHRIHPVPDAPMPKSLRQDGSLNLSKQLKL